MKIFYKILFLSFFMATSVHAYEHCPDLANREDYSQWQLLSGQITGKEAFFMALTRGTAGFDAVTECKYDQGRVVLYQIARAVPINPILWSPLLIMGLTFDTCSKGIEDCSFNLI